MQAAQLLDGFMPGAQKQMIGVSQNNLRVQIVQKVAWKNSLDGGLSSHGHKHRRLHVPMSRMKNPRPRPSGGTSGLKLESKHFLVVTHVSGHDLSRAVRNLETKTVNSTYEHCAICSLARRGHVARLSRGVS